MKNKIFAYKHNNTIFYDEGVNITESNGKTMMYMNSIDCNMIKALNSDEQKLKYLELFSKELQSYEKACIIASLKSDKNKMDLMKELPDDKKVAVIISLDSTEKKRELMENLPDELKEPVIISFSSDEEKLKYINEENQEMVNIKIIQSFESDELKKEYLEKNKSTLYFSDIVSTMKSEEDKKEYINKRIEENQKFVGSDFFDYKLDIIVKSLQNDEDKMKFYDFYIEEYGPERGKAMFVKDLNSDEKKEKLLNSKENIPLKSEIIKSMESDDRKIEFLDDKLLEINKNKVKEEKQKNVEEDLEEYIEKLKNDEITLDEIPKDLLVNNSEKYFELFKEGDINFEDIPQEIMVKHSDKVFELFEEKVYIDLEEIPDSVFEKDIEETIAFCQKNYIDIPDKILIANPQRAMQLCEEDKNYYFFENVLPEQIKIDNPEFCKKQLVENGFESAINYFDATTLTHEEILKICQGDGIFEIPYEYKLREVVKNDMIANVNDYIILYEEYGIEGNGREILYDAIIEVTKNNPEMALNTIKHEFLFDAYSLNVNSVLEIIPEELLTEELIKEAVEIDPHNVSYFPESYRTTELLEKIDGIIDIKEKDEELTEIMAELKKSIKEMEAAKALRDDIAKEKGLDEQKKR